MTSTQRIALIYAAAAASAAGVSYMRGRSSEEIVQDALVHGVLIGTGANVGVWYFLDGESEVATPNHKMRPEIEFGMGSLGAKAINLLGSVNTKEIFTPEVIRGWVFGPVPENPYTVDILPG